MEKAKFIAELVLGTAQLAMPYGTLAPEAAPDIEQSFDILDCAWSVGITALDTAAAYGEAEGRIGAWSRARGVKPRIIGKVPAFSKTEMHPFDFVEAQIRGTCERVGQACIAAMLLHRAVDVERYEAVDAMSNAAQRGTIGKWGVSIYTAAEFEKAMGVPGLTAIEAPISIVDRRLERLGLLAEAARRGIEVFARSVFHQGVLLRPPESIPATIPGLRDVCVEFHRRAASLDMAPGALAIAAVRRVPGLSKVVIGAATSSQVESIAKWSAEAEELISLSNLEDLGAVLDDRALDPRNWKFYLS